MTIDEQGRPEPDRAGDELATLTGFLDFQRATFAWRTRGLDADQLSRPLPPTTMTLGGMLKHLALVEQQWFCQVLLARPATDPWAGVDWKADRDWDWHSARDDAPDELRRLWSASVADSDAALAEALASGGLDQVARAGEVNLRWILTHMIEEYARHNGHADLLREAIDGQTGE